jgi:hypothetical protein
MERCPVTDSDSSDWWQTAVMNARSRSNGVVSRNRPWKRCQLQFSIRGLWCCSRRVSCAYQSGLMYVYESNSARILGLVSFLTRLWKVETESTDLDCVPRRLVFGVNMQDFQLVLETRSSHGCRCAACKSNLDDIGDGHTCCHQQEQFSWQIRER